MVCGRFYFTTLLNPPSREENQIEASNTDFLPHSPLSFSLCKKKSLNQSRTPLIKIKRQHSYLKDLPLGKVVAVIR